MRARDTRRIGALVWGLVLLGPGLACRAPAMTAPINNPNFGQFTGSPSNINNAANFVDVGNDTISLTNIGEGNWGFGTPNSHVRVDESGDGNYFVHDEFRTRGIIQYLALSAVVGDPFTLTVNVASSSTNNTSFGIGVLTFNDPAEIGGDLVLSANAAVTPTLGQFLSTLPGASEYEFYETGELTLADLGAAASGTPFTNAGTFGSVADFSTTLTVSNTFAESHSYVGVALMAKVNVDDSDFVGFDNVSLTVIPEPATLALVAVGLVVLALLRRRC